MTKSQQIKSMLSKTKNFFMDYTNFDKLSTGYGLTSDHSLNPERASIAATGFMFCALIIAHHYDQLTKDDLIERANRTVDALLKMNHHHGFFPHFMSRSDGERFKKSEYSTIDTMLMIMGLIAIDSYINDPDFSKKAQTLIDRIDWKSYLTTYQGKKVFAMSYNDLDQGDYVTGKAGYIYHWHMYAEQLMMYVLYPEDDALEL